MVHLELYNKIEVILMKFLHTSDLHIGKRLHEKSLFEDQQYILKQIVDIAKKQEVDAVLISGDVYDRSIPQADATVLFDNFVTELASCKIKVFMISGNHDSAQRLDFMSSLLRSQDVYFCGSFKGELECVELTDELGSVNIYLLPFIKPSNVRSFANEENISSYEEAVKYVIDSANIDITQRNIILSHQFITGSSTDGSEEIIVGGLDNISSNVYSRFDYVALGHIHRAQNIGSDVIRYSGTPLKYSFSEVSNKKSVTIVEIFEKGNVNISVEELIPLRDLRCIKGSYLDIMSYENYMDENLDDFIKVTLTDEDDIPDAILKIRTVYPNVLVLEYDNKRTRAVSEFNETETASLDTPFEMFESLYKIQFGDDLSDAQVEILNNLIEKIWGDDNETA